MIRHITAALFLLSTLLLGSQAQATHIEYVDYGASTNALNPTLSGGETMTWTFDLLADSMYLWELTTPTSTAGGPTPDLATADAMGSYDPLSTLHYVYLLVRPNHLSDDLGLSVNTLPVAPGWDNPITLYDWGVPGTPPVISDPYDITAHNYQFSVTLTNLTNNDIAITEVILEGCFDTDTTPIPEPASMFLFGTGLAGLISIRRKRKKK